MPRMTMVQAVNLALHQEMAKDERVIVLGEDIGRNEGVFRVTAGLLDAFGAERVIDTPLAESAIVGTAIGMALAGLRPVAEIQFSGFAFLAFAQMDGHAARYRARSCGQWTVPLVMRMPYGGGVRAHEHHSESRESVWASTPGLKVVIPSTPRTARALLVAAIRDPDPVVFMEPKRSYRAFREEVPEQPEVLPIGKARVICEGNDLTLITWGAMLPFVQRAADEVAKERGAQIELIDLLTISPLDGDAVAASVKKTGRCVIVQEAPRSFSVSTELVAKINDRSLIYLEAPVNRVTGHDVITPFFQREQLFIPDEQKIKRAIQETLDY